MVDLSSLNGFTRILKTELDPDGVPGEHQSAKRKKRGSWEHLNHFRFRPVMNLNFLKEKKVTRDLHQSIKSFAEMLTFSGKKCSK